MKAELVTVISKDNLELPALLYSPLDTKRVAIYLHGNGDSGVFYNQEIVNSLATKLLDKGIGLLALNNRGARYKKKLLVASSGKLGNQDKVQLGVHYEEIKDCVLDIDGSIEFLEDKGYETFYLLGFSTGANKICVYEYLQPSNKISKFVLAGPGDDTGIYFTTLGKEKFNSALSVAKNYIKDSKSSKVMPKYTGIHPFSAGSSFDILNPNGLYNTFPYYEALNSRISTKKLFLEYSSIKKPMFVIFGENDEYTYTGGGTGSVLDLLKRKTNPESVNNSVFQIINGADHSFHGYEDTLATRIADWL